MTMDEIIRRVTGVFRDILDNGEIILCRETTADDIEEWDSLAHISLIVAIEKEFRVKFDLLDIKRLKNVGEFLDLIERKLSGV